ncbi:urate hydroxylase PuuD, partial [Corallococcus aberystwythensis]
VLVAVFIAFATWLACQWFAGRAAFLLVGAMMATTMSGNVFFWIIPGQRKNVQALREGRPVDPIHGARGKQRSVHNTYFTLPVLFAMLSNHYSFTYTHKYNWIVLLLIMLGGAAIRQFFVVRHRFKLGNAGNPLPYAMVGVV